MHSMIRDIQLAFRSLSQSPGFTAASLVTLALGIGASAVVFTFVNGLLLRPLPLGDATDRVVSLHGTHPTQTPDDWDAAAASFPDLWDVRAETSSFEDVAAYFDKDFTLYGDETVRVLGSVVTPNLFSALDTQPSIGRDFRADDGDEIGFASVVILSDGLWRNRFGGNPSIVGEQILINEREHTVIGVMPAGFRFPERSDLWTPYNPGERANRGVRIFSGVAVLKSGIGLDEARLELEAIGERLAARYPDTNRGWALHAIPYRDLIVKPAMRVIATALLVAVTLVLLIGCANLASLLLARGTERQRELAVRSALGARRSRLVRQMLVESVVLATLGGLLGTLLAIWAIDAVVASVPEELPYWLRIELDVRVVAFILTVSLVTAVTFGLWPALRVSRIDLGAALGSGRDPDAGRRSLGLQSGLIIGQVAFSLALLAGAALMYQSVLALSRADPGFDEEPLLTMRLYLAGDAYDPHEQKAAFFRDLVKRVEAVPGVRSATATTAIPADDGGIGARIVTRAHPVVDGSEIGVQLVGSTPGFFETLNVPLVSGRPFQPSDLGVDAPPVAVVNEPLANRLWPGQPVVDREVGLVTRSGDIGWLRVVGVAPEIQYEEFGEETEQSELNVFVPYSRTPFREMAILVRAENDPAAITTAVRDAIRVFAPGAPVFMVRTMREVRYTTSWEQRFFGQLLNAFAVAAVLLACLGIYWACRLPQQSAHA